MAVVGGTISTPVGIGIGIHVGSSTGSVEASIDTYYQGALGGDQSSVDRIVALAGLAGGAGIAPTADAKNYAKQKLQALLAQGAVSGPTGTGDYGLPPGTPNLHYTVKPRTGVDQSGNPSLSRKGMAAATPWWVFPAILVAGGVVFYMTVLQPKRAAA